MLGGGKALSIYTALPGNDIGINFVRQALPLSGMDKTAIPVGIDFEAGGELTFSAVTIPIGSNRYWLEDRQTGTFTDLTTQSYTVTLPAKTYGTGRFYIISSANTPTAIDRSHTDDSGLRIWSSGNKLIISGETGIRAICEIFDINGTLRLKRLLHDNSLNTVDLPQNLSVSCWSGLQTG